MQLRIRPALKELIDSFAARIMATNEPLLVKCRAPDFFITKGQSPLDYVVQEHR
jgi:hypothetical protein